MNERGMGLCERYFYVFMKICFITHLFIRRGEKYVLFLHEFYKKIQSSSSFIYTPEKYECRENKE